VALVTSAAGTSQAPTLEVDMPIVDDENEDEDESAKEKLPPTQIAVTAKNKKGRQIKSVTPDGKKITLTYTDLPLNSTILFHTP